MNFRLALIFMAIAFVGVRAAAQTNFNELAERPTRPSIVDIENFLRNHPVPPAPDGRHLPKNEDRPESQLQNNFAFWGKEILKRAPHMLVTFEKNLPGATYVFVGRDMAIIADLFEGFFRALGQPDRVRRLGMSGATLESLQGSNGSANTQRFLEASGVDIGDAAVHPIIFVDSISDGGGRQLRALLRNIYSLTASDPHAAPTEKFFRYNAVGLAVSSTKSGYANLEQSEIYFTNLERQAEDPEQRSTLDDAKFQLMVYRDGRQEKSFVGINESGYSHWTGAWHESYAALEPVPTGMLAVPGPPASPEMRRALLQFQASIVGFAESAVLRTEVQAEASRQGFEFSAERARGTAQGLRSRRDLGRLVDETLPEDRYRLLKDLLRSNRIDPQSFAREIERVWTAVETSLIVAARSARSLAARKAFGNELRSLAAAAPTPGLRRKILRRALVSAASPLEFREWSTIADPVPTAESGEVLREALPKFFGLSPSSDEVNKLMLAFPKQSNLIYREALRRAENFTDVQSLTKPAVTTADDQAALRALKERSGTHHPLMFWKTSRVRCEAVL